MSKPYAIEERCAILREKAWKHRKLKEIRDTRKRVAALKHEAARVKRLARKTAFANEYLRHHGVPPPERLGIPDIKILPAAPTPTPTPTPTPAPASPSNGDTWEPETEDVSR